MDITVHLSFTVHFITDEYHLKHYLLETKEFTESHTAKNIAEEMTSIINEWGLEYAGLIAATIDNASNIRAALHLLQCLHMPCFSHVLNLAVEKAYSVQHNLLHDVITRWNSSYYMVERVVEQHQPICAALLELRKGELMPSDGEFAAMSDFLSVMEPVV